MERRWQEAWQRAELGRAPDRPTAGAFTIVLPPPNVTGDLHLGQLLGNTVMDLLVRRARMAGQPTLWLPGIDHAGLATQARVRSHLAGQGVKLEELPREEVLARVEQWKREHERRIGAELRAGGFSLDWSRYRYTMDPAYGRATRRAFVTLHRAGLVYRGERFVNWDPTLRTAISDLEVEHSEEPTTLLYLRYPWADGSPGGIVVATVRPETIFGDVAVAVHPDDARHRASVGRAVRVPLVDREVPVIADAGVDPTFGNGALKITPRHDLLDYEIFRRHSGLPMPPDILDAEGRLTSDWVPEEFRGRDREDARPRVTETLRAGGFVDHEAPYVHAVGRSERSNAVIEPRLSKQWFVRMAPLAAPAVEAVRSGEIRLFPARWELTFFRWMENVQDWCISRQIAWGHPIPVYYCSACRAETAAEEPPVRCPKCDHTPLTADPDVLDTWFSSWLWPFATLGWPEDAPDLAHYFPTSLLETGRDIMFFWVARMMMASYFFLGRPPFRTVYFHGILRDEHGRKLSKHLGNSPDPVELIRERGADALRFSLVFPNPVDQDGMFGPATLDSARNFLTKVWNLVRFAQAHAPDGTDPPDRAPALTADSPLENRWILARWRRTVADFEEALSGYEITRAAGLLHSFLWYDLADRYVEVSKDALAGRRGEPLLRETRAVLLFVLERTLRLLHPLAPHVTEELWHALPHRGELLARAAWPHADEAPDDPEALIAMEVVYDAIRTLRSLRAANRLGATSIPPAWVRPSGEETGAVLRAQRELVLQQARVGALDILEAGAPPPAGTAPSVTAHGEFYLALPTETAPAERQTLERERTKLSALLTKTEQRLADAGFRAHAPPEVLKAAEEKARELAERVRRIKEHLAAGPALGTP
ncbi:MAG: valine--tRNA ligase [Thermoplasmata archaeon]|nr:valine--tRNA ligase [Thermoplasmata archaeon]